MDETDSAAIMFMALCKQGRADEALRVASEANFPDLIMGLNKMADACDDSSLGKLDRDFIMRMERYLLNEKAGRPMLDQSLAMNLTAEEIAKGKRETTYWSSLAIHHAHDDLIRIAYAWLDAQVKTSDTSTKRFSIRDLIESWSGCPVSISDIEVAATLHALRGRYPYFNLSARLTQPARRRLDDLPAPHGLDSDPREAEYKRFEE